MINPIVKAHYDKAVASRKDQINDLEKNLLFAAELMKRCKKNMDRLQVAFKAAQPGDEAAEKVINRILLELEDQIETMSKALQTAGSTVSGPQDSWPGMLGLRHRRRIEGL